MKAIIYLLAAIIIALHPTQNQHNKRITTSYTGWWIYGENQHIFKDEISLEEWNLKFVNENNEELTKLYLAVTEMEYFPMECIMEGVVSKDTLLVVDFEITYIQGCGE